MSYLTNFKTCPLDVVKWLSYGLSSTPSLLMYVILKMIEDHTERIPMTVLEGNDREEELSNTQLFLIITGTW